MIGDQGGIGLHHVTAIASGAQANLDFYATKKHEFILAGIAVDVFGLAAASCADQDIYHGKDQVGIARWPLAGTACAAPDTAYAAASGRGWKAISYSRNSSASANTFAAEAVDVASKTPIANVLPQGMSFDLTAEGYARDWALPQLYFNVMIAYAILRSQGVNLSKADYVAHMFPCLRPHGRRRAGHPIDEATTAADAQRQTAVPGRATLCPCVLVLPFAKPATRSSSLLRTGEPPNL